MDEFEVRPEVLRTAGEALAPFATELRTGLTAVEAPVQAAQVGNPGLFVSEALGVVHTQVGRAVDQAAQNISHAADALGRTATGYEQADDEAARSFRDLLQSMG